MYKRLFALGAVSDLAAGLIWYIGAGGFRHLRKINEEYRQQSLG